MSYEPLVFDITVLEDLINRYHAVADVPIKGSLAENFLVRSVEAKGLDVFWDEGSHKPGSDIFIQGNKIGKSIKATKLPQNGLKLNVSSFRTTKWNGLLEKLDGIRKIEEEIESYLIFCRQEWTNKVARQKRIEYDVFDISPEVFSVDNFHIEQIENGNYQGYSDIGTKIDIVNNMSGQVWFNIPLDKARELKMIKTIGHFGPYNVRIWK